MMSDITQKKRYDTRKEKVEILLQSVCALVIFALSIYYIRDMYYPTFGDEFGYWGNAAFANHMNWSKALSTISYYSYGYSTILYVILLAGFTGTVAYRLSIVVNGILTVGSFLLMCAIADGMYSDFVKFRKSRILISFVVSCYSGTLMFAKCSWGESLLIFLFLLSIFSLLNYLTKKSNIFLGLFMFSLMGLYVTHMRTIGVLIAGMMILVLMFYRKEVSWKKIVAAIIFVGVTLICYELGKKYLVNHVYLANELVSRNDYSAAADRFSNFKSLGAFVKLFQSIVGKAFYLIVSSCTIVLWGFKRICWESFQGIRKIKTENSRFEIYIYIGLSFAATFAICALYMLDPPNRGYLSYGRYNETILPVMLLIGIMEILRTKGWVMEHVVHCLISLGITGIVCYAMIDVTANAGGIWSTGLCPFYTIFTKEATASFYAMGVSLFVATFAMLAIHIPAKKVICQYLKYIAAALSMIMFWLWAVYSVSTTWMVAEQNLYVETTHKIEEFVDKFSYQGELGIDEDERALALQFALPEHSVAVLTEEKLSSSEELPEIIFMKQKMDTDILLEEYDKYYCDDIYDVFLKKGTGLLDQWASMKQSISLKTMKIPEAGVSVEGYRVWGPYMPLLEGTYQLTFELDGVSGSGTERLGYGEVAISSENKTIISQDYYASDISDGKLQMVLPFALEEQKDKIEFKIYAEAGTALNLKSIQLERVASFYEVAHGNREEMDSFIEMVENHPLNGGIVCLKEPEDNISTKYLKETLQENPISDMGSEMLLLEKPDGYLVVPEYNHSWIKLLDSYSLIKKYTDFSVFVLNTTAEKYFAGESLSTGEYVDMKAWAQKANDGFLANTYSNIEPGAYEAVLKIDTDHTIQKEKPENLIVEVWYGADAQEQQVIPYAETISVAFEAARVINDLNFYVYTEKGSILSVTPEYLIQRENSLEYIYDNKFGGIVERIQDWSPEPVLILGDARKENRKKIEKYIRIRGFKNVAANTSYFEKTDWKENLPDNVVIPSYLKEVFALMKEGYSVLYNSGQYTLMSRGHEQEYRFSDGMKLRTDYFTQLTEGGVIENRLILPEGIFGLEIQMDTMGAGKLSPGVARIVSGKNIIAERTMGVGTERVQIAVSGTEDGLPVSLQMVGKEARTIRGTLESVTYLHDGQVVDLKKMLTTNPESRYLNGKIVCNNTEAGTIIYGPYASLKPGKYVVDITYESRTNTSVYYDAVMNEGSVTVASGNAESTAGETKTVSLAFELEDECEDMEFRLSIPAGMSADLVDIMAIRQ